MRDVTVPARSERSAPEQNTLPVAVRTTDPHASVGHCGSQSLGELVEQARRQRIPVVRGVERQRRDGPLPGDVDQLVRHGSAV